MIFFVVGPITFGLKNDTIDCGKSLGTKHHNLRCNRRTPMRKFGRAVGPIHLNAQRIDIVVSGLQPSDKHVSMQPGTMSQAWLFKPVGLIASNLKNTLYQVNIVITITDFFVTAVFSASRHFEILSGPLFCQLANRHLQFCINPFSDVVHRWSYKFIRYYTFPNKIFSIAKHIPFGANNCGPISWESDQ